jgi:integrase
MNCLQCGAELPADGRRDQKYCGRSCSGKAYYHRGKAGLPPRPPRRHPALESDNPVLVAAAIYARELGAAHDWSGEITNRCLDALVTLMAGRSTGDRVPLTEVRTRPHRLASRRRLVEILSHFDLLEDDTESPIRAWIDRVTAELPPGFAEPSHHWLLTLLLGDARSRPRSPTTLYKYFGAVRPPLAHWSTSYDHLREVTKADVDAALRPFQGNRRHNLIKALRSLFRHAKKNGLVFANPTAGLTSQPADQDLLPITDDEVRSIEHLASEPLEHLVVALSAEHACRTSVIRKLTLDDIDLPNRRITLAGHNQRLGELTHGALIAWLDHRRDRWPHTPNRHVLLTTKTALRTTPVSQNSVKQSLSDNGFTIERIRADRILHEALTAGPDPLHLSLVFGISHNTALRYTTMAERLLSDELEQPVEP